MCLVNVTMEILKLVFTNIALGQLHHWQGLLLDPPQLPPHPGQLLGPVDPVDTLQVLVDTIGVVLDDLLADSALEVSSLHFTLSKLCFVILPVVPVLSYVLPKR